MTSPLGLLGHDDIEHRGVGEPHAAAVLTQTGKDVGKDQQRDDEQDQQPIWCQKRKLRNHLLREQRTTHFVTPCGGACSMLATRRYANTNRAMSCTQSRSVRN